jgi:hypothetical protein
MEEETIQADDAGRASEDILGYLIRVVKRWVSPQDRDEIDEFGNRRSHDKDGPLHPLYCETRCMLRHSFRLLQLLIWCTQSVGCGQYNRDCVFGSVVVFAF